MTTIGAPPFLMARHGRVGQVFSGAAQAIAMTVLIILGLLSGLATPTETAVAASVYAFLVGVFIYRELPLRKVPKIVIDSAISSAAILVLIGTARCSAGFWCPSASRRPLPHGCCLSQTTGSL